MGSGDYVRETGWRDPAEELRIPTGHLGDEARHRVGLVPAQDAGRHSPQRRSRLRSERVA